MTNKILLKSLLIVTSLLCSLGAMAHSFEVDGIYYNITDEDKKTVEVTYKGTYYNQYEYEYTGSVIIPESVTYDNTTYTVTSIGDKAFNTSPGVTSVTIPNTITSIGSSALSGTSISEITIHNNITSIGNSAFAGCTGLTEITIPDNVTSLGSSICSGCSNLKKATIPNHFTSLHCAFSKCSSLTSLTLPEVLTEICDFEFNDCTSLASITIPNGVTSIGQSAFKNCTSLTSITIPENVTSIGEKAFYNCSQLSTIDLKSEVITWMGVDAIAGTAYYNNLPDMPGGLVYVGKVLYNYKGTVPEDYKVEIKEGTVLVAEAAFFNKAAITSVTMPESLKAINKQAFNYNSITTLTIPDSVTSIGDDAFSGCPLTSLTLGSSVSSIGYNAFGYNRNLQTIICRNTEPATIDSKTFASVVKSIPVYVPEDCVAKYSNADHWSEFTYIRTINDVVEVLLQNSYYNNVILYETTESQQKFKIVNTDDRFSLKTVLFNGEDVTDEVLQADGVFTTPSLRDNAVINISYSTDEKDVTEDFVASYSNADNRNELTYIRTSNDVVELLLQNSYYNDVILYEEKESQQKLKIVNTDERFYLNTVLFNGEDVTNEVNEADGVYITPSLSNNSVIKINYYIPTDEKAPIQDSHIKIYGHGRNIVVSGCEAGDNIAIYKVDGVLLRSINASNNIQRIEMPTNAIYIVKVTDVVTKVAL